MSTGLWFFRPPYRRPPPSQRFYPSVAQISFAPGLAVGTGTATGFTPLAARDGIAAGTGSAAAITSVARAATGAAIGSGTLAADVVAPEDVPAIGHATGSGTVRARAVSEFEDSSEVFRLCQLDGIKFQSVSNTVVIIPEVGEPMTRKMYTGNFEDISGTFKSVSRAQAIAIKDFWRDILHDGRKKFLAEHPITQAEADIFMFLKEPEFSRNGHLYDVSMVVRKVEE